MILYQHPLSPYAQKIRIALREKGVPFEAKPLPVSGPDRTVVRVNPRVELPALDDSGAVIFDSTIILEYLEDRFPDPPLLPSGAAERAKVRMIEEVCDTHYEAINWGLGELLFFERAPGALGEELRRRAKEQIRDLHRWLENLLGDATWLNGSQFGWGDLAAAPYVSMSQMFEIPPEPGTLLADWLERVMRRASVAATVDEARESLPGMAGAAQKVRDGRMKRQYRDHRLEWMIRSGGLQIVLDGIAAGNIRFTETTPFAQAAPSLKTASNDRG
jgi:glutathione S-transferase/RNA polymerase-associated protein